LLHAILSFLHRLNEGGGSARLRSTGHGLVHALLPLAAEPFFGCLHKTVQAILAILLPADAALCFADFAQLRGLHKFLRLATRPISRSKTVGAGAGRADRKMELLLLLASDAIEELEMIAKHERRGVHLALYYIGLASSDGASAATTGDADASVDGMMDVDSAEEASPSLLRQGDLRVLLSLLHSAGSELHPALLALLLRLLLLPHPGSYVHGSSVVLPQLHDAHGMLLGPRPTPLAECLRCQLLSFDDETLEGWLGAKLDAGPLVALVSRKSRQQRSTAHGGDLVRAGARHACGAFSG
jgi:hypothetical protein